nr:ABC transporter permease subunit [Thalassobacillus sp. CUG 92003]
MLISAAPALFKNGQFFNISAYTEGLAKLVGTAFHPEDWLYVYKGSHEPLFQFLWDPYSYSMTLFLGGVVLALVMAFLLALGTLFLPKWAKSVVTKLLNILEALPDLLLAVMIQMLIVYMYKQTDILVMQVATVGQEKIYWLPIVTLAIVPMVSFYKLILLLLEEEMTKPYVSLARSKGLEALTIINVHMLRNIMKNIFYHSKVIVWAALSSLLVIEYIFNINGITTYFIDGFTPIATAGILLMIFTPFFVIYQGIELFLFKEGKMPQAQPVKMNRFAEGTFWRVRKPGLRTAFKDSFAYFKNVPFLCGFFLIGGLLVWSIVYTFTAEPLIDQYFQIYNDEGELVSSAPHSPAYLFLGTSELGFSIFDQLVVGAKYTIIFALLIALLRVFFGFLLAIPYAFFLPEKVRGPIDKIVDSMHFLPLTIIAFLLLYPVLWMPQGGFTTSQSERIVYQILVLAILVLPLMMTLFGNEMRLLMRQEFVASTKVLGGSSLHLLRRHLLPHLRARIGIVFGQQFIQTLLIFIHLGLFNLYFGGTKVSYDPDFPDPPQSTTYEWSGLIGASKNSLMTGRWWYIIPALVGFMLLILAMQMIIKGIKDVQQVRVGVSTERSHWWSRLKAWRSKQEKQKEAVTESPGVHDFERLDRRRTHNSYL